MSMYGLPKPRNHCQKSLWASFFFFFFFVGFLRTPRGEGNGTPLQNSCLENPMGRRAWKAAVHGVMKSDFTFTFLYHALEKEMATHSSVLAWRFPGMEEPGGLPSMGSHRVTHDWSNLAATMLKRTWGFFSPYFYSNKADVVFGSISLAKSFSFSGFQSSSLNSLCNWSSCVNILYIYNFQIVYGLWQLFSTLTNIEIMWKLLFSKNNPCSSS